MRNNRVKFPNMVDFCRNFTKISTKSLNRLGHLLDSFLTKWFPWSIWGTESFERKIEVLSQTLSYSLLRIKFHLATHTTNTDWILPTPFTNYSENYIHAFVSTFQTSESDFIPFFRTFWKDLTGSSDLQNITCESPYSAIPYAEFLHEYDTFFVKSRGVIHTPSVVIRCIWEGIDVLLKRELNFSQGLDTNSLHFYDPACGSLDFEIEYLRTFIQFHPKNGMDENLKLLRRFGENFRANEISPTAAAIGWLLWQDCFHQCLPENDFSPSLQISFFNTLNIPNYNPYAEIVPINSPDAMSTIPFVIFGNPPYAVSSANKDTWIVPLMKRYAVDEPNQTRLYDDYVKFFRYSHWLLESRSSGIIAFITNRKFLDGKIFYGMRKALLEDFSAIYIIDLFGDTRNRKHDDSATIPNIFNIQTGVCITFLVKTPLTHTSTPVHYLPILSDPMKELVKVWSDQSFPCFEPCSPHYLFLPQKVDHTITRLWNSQTISLPACFQKTSRAMISSRDAFMIDPDPAELVLNLAQLENRDFHALRQRRRMKSTRDDLLENESLLDHFNFAQMRANILPLNYRPWDQRYTIFYTINQRCGKSVFLEYLRQSPTNPTFSLEDPKSTRNLAINFVQSVQKPPFNHILITKGIVDSGFFGYSTSKVAPLWINDQSNVSAVLQEEIKKIAPQSSLSEIISYLYAILHCSVLNDAFLPFLLHEFPRVLLPSNAQFFHEISALGHELIHMHLFQWDSSMLKELDGKIDQNIQRLKHHDQFRCQDYSYDKIKNELVLIFCEPQQTKAQITPKIQEQIRLSVSKEIWQYRIGSVQVLPHWLDARIYPHYQLPWKHVDWNSIYSMIKVIDRTLIVIGQINHVFLGQALI